MDSATDRIYLDNAATSWPKPEAVYRAVDDYQRRLGAPAGRGAYREALEVQNLVTRCRKSAATLLHAADPRQIVFTFNGTDSLNLALHGALRVGDHAIVSALEHNSVLRPLRELESVLGVSTTLIPANAVGQVDPEDYRRALRPNTRLIGLLHASNVTGALQPIAEVGRIVREAGALFLVDAAQTAGAVPIDVQALGIDLLACPGHKSLLGPLGTGLLYIRPGVELQIRSLRQGGTGTSSETDRQPESLPDKFESGNHNVPGICGLAAGIDFVLEQGIENIRAREQAHLRRLRDGLSGVAGITLYGPPSIEQSVGILSLNVVGYDPQDLATILDDSFAIQTRAGLHCAPGAHRHLGTLETGGTLRLSVGPFTTDEHIDRTIDALSSIAGAV
ncbi:MAG TPA: aminotransferase class V-fold PLP-dependent enzyme [Planctomycetaceae bacterium]|nr:aminotransferase class V-fold PLP-dependent enzyme [Planctomycetaceae bacterium]